MKRWLYFFVVACVSGLLAWGIMTLYIYFDVGLDTRSTAPAQRFICPDQHAIELSDTGLHYVYVEYIASYDSVTYTMDRLPCSTWVTVKDGTVGQVGPIRGAESQVRYSWPGRAGLSLFEFDVIKPGDVTLDVSFDTQATHGPLVFAVGSATSMVSWMERGIILFVVSFSLFFATGVILWRYKIRERLRPPGDQAGA